MLCPPGRCRAFCDPIPSAVFEKLLLGLPFSLSPVDLWGLAFAVAAGLLEGAAEEELDLPVQATQIVVRPTLDGLQQGWIDTK